MRVVTWNCRRATATSPVWDHFRELAPDVALLQEVADVPASIAKEWTSVSRPAVTKSGGIQRFSTAVFARGEIAESLTLTSPTAWVQSELARFSGNLISCRVRLGDGPEINLVSVYSPAWPVDRGRLVGIDSTGVRLAQNADVWLADVLLAALQAIESPPDVRWIVGGDFNLSETFDLWKGGPRGNREYLDRMAAFGLTECLRHTTGALTPTFRNASGGKIVHQMDHLFVSRPLADRLTECRVGCAERIFDSGLSDHLPIIAEFNGGV
jgi:exonuclease III